MRFEVPQFINVEDKIFGRFTLKQFIYFIGGGGLIFILYKTLPFFVVLVLGIPILAFSLALAFYKPNGRPFIEMVESFLLYSFSDKFYLWKQNKQEKESFVASVEQKHQPFPKPGELPPKEEQRISDLAWSLDILDFEQK